MTLNYQKLSRKPRIFLSLTGNKVSDFNKIVNMIRLECEQKFLFNKSTGRKSKLRTLEDKVLELLIYYRTYITHEFIGYLFNLHNSNICRLFKKLEPMLARKITIKKDRSLTKEKILEIIADVTEQPTQRPKKKQKKYYSGKKKTHTMKTEIVIKDNGQILSVSRMFPGKRHDFRIRKESKPLPVYSNKYVDSGYQGLQKIASRVTLPFRRSKKHPLTMEKKIHNKNLAIFRIKVENKIRELKIFRILKEVYRNFHKKHNMRFNIIAGIVNLKNGF